MFKDISSFLPLPADSDFSLHNIPFGVFSVDHASEKKIGTRIGDTVIDLKQLESLGYFDICYDREKKIFSHEHLNAFAAESLALKKAVRLRIQTLFSQDISPIQTESALISAISYPADRVKMHLPGLIGDYTDFYSSIDHATHVGRLFRDKAHPLLPNYVHLPVAYHGRASSIIPGGQGIKRPQGQILPPDQETPLCRLTRALDFELEMGFFIGEGNVLGEPIRIEQADQHILGLVIVNDWSARDIQKWEYVPLGPFLSKSFATSISPWVVTLEALKSFAVKPRTQTPQPLPYLSYDHDFSLDIQMSVALKTSRMVTPEIICQTRFSSLYWTMAQQLAHHTIGGCNLRTMDLLASGTISGSEPEAMGSLLELTENGAHPLSLSTGEERIYLEDGDEIIMRAFCEKTGIRVGFGELRSTVLSEKM